MIRTGWLFLSLASCLLSIMLFGCGGGGGGGGTAEPNLKSSSLSYDFGFVTMFNSPAAKEIILSNDGNAPLEISSINLAGAGFMLDLDSEANFCGAAPLTINAGGSCSVAIDFSPIEAELYSDTLTVSSNDPDSPALGVTVTGNGIEVVLKNQNIRINQVEPDTCPSSALTAYVSVTDQTGYPISGLQMGDFSLTETVSGIRTPMPITSFNFVKEITAPISVVLVMDYSGSITEDTTVVEAMETGVISFINELGAKDIAEIVKFDDVVEVVQPFTSDKVALSNAVTTPWDEGTKTRFYDAVYQAVSDVANQTTERRAVIVLSDGLDDDGTGNQQSDASLQSTIDYAVASGVPVFTIGIGVEVQRADLTKLSAETGGQDFDALNADNLRTIYKQQADILFVDQYVLTYDSFFTGGTAILTVGVKLDGPEEFVSRDITPCL